MKIPVSQQYPILRIFSRSTLIPFLACVLLLAAILCASILIGSATFPLPSVLQAVFSGPPDNVLEPGLDRISIIVWELRIPRAILVTLVGIALGCSGCAYQGVFRNPLADPYLLGIGSGASLGAVTAVSFGLTTFLPGLSPIPGFAFLGALLTVFAVHRIAKPERGGSSGIRLILSGVALGAFTNSMAAFLMLRTRSELQRTMSWLLGGFTAGGWEPVLFVTPYFLSGFLLLAAMGRVLNILQLGEEQAQHAGLHVEKARAVLLAAASILTAAAVSFAGIIGFVGLAVPHIARLLWGTDYRVLLPFSGLLGGILLLAADILARVVISPQELPVGIVTALFGVPFFLYLLRKPQTSGLAGAE